MNGLRVEGGGHTQVLFTARYWTRTCGREGEELHGLLNVRVVKPTTGGMLGAEDGVLGVRAVRVLGGFSDPAGTRLAKGGI